MSKRYKVGIVGLGAIGLQIARTIDQGDISNFDLVAIATRDEKKAAKNLETFDHIPNITRTPGKHLSHIYQTNVEHLSNMH